MTGVCICIPSRGRAGLAWGTIADLKAKLTRPDSVIVLALDRDDPTLPEYAAMPRDGGQVVNIAERESTIGGRYDRCRKLVPDAAIYVPHADDSIILEPGFDQVLMDAIGLFPNHCGMVEFPGHGSSYTFGFGLGSGLARTFDTIGVPCFPYWWEETWWGEIGRLSGLILMREQINMVPLGAASIAEARSVSKTTTGLRDVMWWAEFFDRTRSVRVAMANRLIVGQPAYRKEQIRASWPLQIERFVQVNAGLRDAAIAAKFERQFQGADGVAEERYQLTKARAEEYLKERGL